MPHGADMSAWTPAGSGGAFEISPTLQPLAPFKDDILLLGNLTHNTGRALLDGAGDHGRCCGSYLTGVQVSAFTGNWQQIDGGGDLIAFDFRTDPTHPTVVYIAITDADDDGGESHIYPLAPSFTAFLEMLEAG